MPDIKEKTVSDVDHQDVLNFVRVVFQPADDRDNHLRMIAQRHYNAYGVGGDIRKAPPMLGASHVKSAIKLYDLARILELELLPVERLDDHR